MRECGERQQLGGVFGRASQMLALDGAERREAVVDEVVDERLSCRGVIPVTRRLARTGALVVAG
jgi:hypothetical protein